MKKSGESATRPDDAGRGVLDGGLQRYVQVIEEMGDYGGICAATACYAVVTASDDVPFWGWNVCWIYVFTLGIWESKSNRIQEKQEEAKAESQGISIDHSCTIKVQLVKVIANGERSTPPSGTSHMPYTREGQQSGLLSGKQQSATSQEEVQPYEYRPLYLFPIAARSSLPYHNPCTE